jgi:hypothetical protein
MNFWSVFDIFNVDGTPIATECVVPATVIPDHVAYGSLSTGPAAFASVGHLRFAAGRGLPCKCSTLPPPRASVPRVHYSDQKTVDGLRGSSSFSNLLKTPSALEAATIAAADLSSRHSSANNEKTHERRTQQGGGTARSRG